MAAAGGDQGDAVLPDAAVDLDLLDGGLHREQPGGVDERVEHHLLASAGDPAVQDVVLLLGRGVAEGDPQQEPVELGLRERVGAFVLDRVGRGEDVERRGQREGAALDGDLALLHRLEQGRLGLGRGAVDLVGQQQAGEQRARAEVELARALVVDERPGEVGGEQVGGELGAGELQAEGLRERPGGQRLAEPREVLEQHVAAREDPGQDQPQRAGLADHDRGDPSEDGVGEVARLLGVHCAPDS